MKGDPRELKWNARDLVTLRHVVERYCQRRRVAVQAGGCLGVFPKYLASQFQRVYTFEPAPELFGLMCENVPEGNVVKLQAALGRRRGRMVKAVCELPYGKIELHPGMTRVQSGGMIPTLLLDDLGLDACDLLYLDIEGDELYAIEGAEATIGMHKPVLVCEVNRSIEYHGLARETIFAHINDLGYDHVETLRSDFVFVHRMAQ